ncbi:Purine nucleoside phosphorylase [Mizuhopecten yessoensis]|uniref:purine-nucleoside phosphorylase n=1 Tax=Mizuhopecten yessoensis TaxID=6573 RepID=A0A210QN19_MIZYE|nr:Purine nucleoside phosphorylase [Mizuhopecten yessoensis]
MSKAYSKRLRDHAQITAKSIGLQGFTLREGVYFMYTGPCIETVSEGRFIHMLGADVVGMSTCPEVTVTVHCGMEVFGISIVTNKSALKSDSDEVVCTIEEVLDTAAVRSKDLQKLITAMVETLDLHPTPKNKSGLVQY